MAALSELKGVDAEEPKFKEGANRQHYSAERPMRARRGWA